MQKKKVLRKLAFLGAGKMATAICQGILAKQCLGKKQLIATDILEQARTSFSQQTNIFCGFDNEKAVIASEAILFAVKPQDAEHVLTPLRQLFRQKLLISIAAGISLEQLFQWSHCPRIVRVMPNMPVTIGKGVSAYTCSAEVSLSDQEFVKTMFSSVGIVREVQEEKMDVITALSGSGPAYVFLFIQALTDAAKTLDLEEDIAQEFAIDTVLGAAEMLKRKKGTPEGLRKKVTSPGGTTAAGIQVLMEGGFQQLVAQCIYKAKERSIALRENT